MKKQFILVKAKENSRAIVNFNNEFITEGYIGKNGVTNNKIEGDGKTPLGIFNIGVSFGVHKNIATNLQYIQINPNMYWVDDINSKYYNKLVDTTKVNVDWKSAEHLIKYPKEYEYAIEIKTNPNNEKNRGSAIFLHCSNQKPTSGCVAINTYYMIELLKKLKQNDLIYIEKGE